MEDFIGFIMIVYIMFCCGVGLRYSFEEENLLNRTFTFALVFIFAPLVLGFDITRKILSK